MKQLGNISDTRQILTIEAARHSFQLLKSAHSALIRKVRRIEHRLAHEKPCTNKGGLSALESAWQLIDMGFRFGRLLAQIRGLKHRDPRYLNSHISGIASTTNPILGTLSWVSEDGLKNILLTVGALPAGIEFTSLSYDSTNKEFLKQLVLIATDKDIQLQDIFRTYAEGYAYLHEWLLASNLLERKELSPSVVVVPLELMDDAAQRSSNRYTRVKVSTGPFTKKTP